VPTAWPVASPSAPTSATLVPERSVAVHAPMFDTSWVLPSEKVAVATKRCVVPLGTDAALGVTASEVRVAAVTVSVVDAVLPPYAALIVAWPRARPVAMPSPSIEATPLPDRSATVQSAALVRFCTVPSEYVARATKACEVPLAMLGLDGLS